MENLTAASVFCNEIRMELIICDIIADYESRILSDQERRNVLLIFLAIYPYRKCFFCAKRYLMLGKAN